MVALLSSWVLSLGLMVSAGPGLPVFPAGVPADYQIGGAYRPDPEVGIVIRDRTDRPALERFSICYVNAFQTQPHRLRWWQVHHPDLLLRSRTGQLVLDQTWGEVLFDISTAVKRRVLAKIVGQWFAGCARSGFSGIEPDNLDSWTRSRGRLQRADAVAFARLLTARAHRLRLLIGQKNAAGLASLGPSLGFDFAVTEGCEVYRECDRYTDAYESRVIEIEYDDVPHADRVFARACAARADQVSLLMRDRDVSPRGAPGYVYRTCE